MGGSWKLIVPETRAQKGAGAVKPGERVTSARANLLKNDQPTMMQEWLLTAIRIPVLTGAVRAGEAAFVMTVTTTIRVGGEIAFQDNKEVLIPLGTTLANALVQADLTNPLLVPHGRTLTIEVSGSPSIETEASTSALLGVETPFGGAGSAVGNPSEGTIAYIARDLSGHRTL